MGWGSMGDRTSVDNDRHFLMRKQWERDAAAQEQDDDDSEWWRCRERSAPRAS